MAVALACMTANLAAKVAAARAVVAGARMAHQKMAAQVAYVQLVAPPWSVGLRWAAVREIWLGVALLRSMQPSSLASPAEFEAETDRKNTPPMRSLADYDYGRDDENSTWTMLHYAHHDQQAAPVVQHRWAETNSKLPGLHNTRQCYARGVQVPEIGLEPVP